MRLDFRVQIFASLAVVGVALAACGSSGSKPASPKSSTALLDGTYSLQSISCTSGALSSDGQSSFNALKDRAVFKINNATINLDIKISDTCTMTIASQITDLKADKMIIEDGATTCSKECSSKDCEASEASKKVSVHSYKLEGNIFTMTDSDNSEDFCENLDALPLYSYKK